MTLSIFAHLFREAAVRIFFSRVNGVMCVFFLDFQSFCRSFVCLGILSGATWIEFQRPNLTHMGSEK